MTRPSAALILVTLGLSSGCIAIKPTARLASLEEAWHDANEAEAAEEAIYEHTLAEQYRLKAREEWGYSDYGAAEDLARKGENFARRAEEIARYGSADEGAADRAKARENLENAEDIVPEEVDRTTAPPTNADEEDQWDE